jgi:cytochrome P450
MVPKGTPIGMSAYLTNTNEGIFPQAMDFVPERWIDEQGRKNHNLEKHMFSFSRGSRQCMGMKYVFTPSRKPNLLNLLFC